MQGRLSPPVDGRIQAFPWLSWREEFPVAERNGFQLMEWTLDQDRLHENPLMTAAGQAEIRELSLRHRVRVASLTGDCFMQAPFWKAKGAERESLQRDFREVAAACAAVGVSIIVVPLVDGGRLDDPEQEEVLVSFLRSQAGVLSAQGLTVAFECDFAPAELARLMGRFDSASFGVNYDIGNSAALGFRPSDEFAAYGRRVVNVHIKDRVRGGSTVPLGRGAADFEAVFEALARIGYHGNCILQTARADDGDHAGILCRFRDMTQDWLNRYEA